MIVKYFKKGFLGNNLEVHAQPDVFGRGSRYFMDDLVGKIRISILKNSSKISISALVSGSDAYLTEISFSLKTGKFSDFSCDCPYDWGVCKHSVALGLKFIKLYTDFTSSTDLEFDDYSEFTTVFGEWLKNAEDNQAEDWEGEFGDGKNDDELKYEYENESKKGKKIKDAEIVESEKTEPEKSPSLSDGKSDLKELLESIGFNVDRLPDHILDQLKNIRKDKVFKKEKQKQTKQKIKKAFNEKYYLFVSHGYRRWEVNIDEYGRDRYSWNRPDPKEIFRDEKDFLTKEEKELLIALEDSSHYGHETDWGRLFCLIENIGIKAYFGSKRKNNELKFNHQDSEKIKVKMSLRQDKYCSSSSYSDCLDLPKFLLEISGDFGTIEKPKFLAGRDNIIHIENNAVNFHKSSPVLFSIFSRMPQGQSGYYYDNQFRNRKNIWWAELVDDEIIKINEVIEALRDNFDLETNLLPDFEIKKFKKPNPVVSVDYDSLKNHLKVSMAMDYGFDKVDISITSYRKISGGKISFDRRWDFSEKKLHIKVEDKKISYAPFDFEREKNIFKEFSGKHEFGFSTQLKTKKIGQKQIMKYTEEFWPVVRDSGYPVVFLKDKLTEFFEAEFKADFKVDFDAENDWLAFDLECYCGKDKITLDDLRRYAESKDDFFMINGKMTRIANTEELERLMKMLKSFRQNSGQKFEGRTYHAPELEDFIGSRYYTSKVAASFKKFIKEAQSGRPIEKVKIPAKIKKTLRDYQEDGISWFYFLRKYRFGGILADDMGLGKTLQALSLLEMNMVKNKPSIVLCPKTLLFNWQDEATKFFPQMKVLIIEGSLKDRIEKIKQIEKYDLIVTSYSSLKKDAIVYEKKNLKFNYCVIDEAQFIKNHKTQNSQAAKKIHADYRLALTGTPLENSVSEIWSIFDFLMPGFLGQHKNFVEIFQTPIMKNNDPEALRMLRKKISCFMLRRTKEKVLQELPPKVEKISHCELGLHQNILYQEILSNVKSEIFETVKKKGFASSQIHILAGLTKLRQVCNHPQLLLKGENHKEYASAKMDLLFELVDEIVSANRKVLIFSQFTQMLDILAKEMNERKIGYNYLSGKTKNRKEVVRDFNENINKNVFLISLKAGGTGLNLVSADNVIIFDPWWNPSVENQAIDRAHRIGQKSSVNVFKLIAKGTIEESILKLQEKKKFLFDNVVGESKDLFKKLTWEDVKEIFK